MTNTRRTMIGRLMVIGLVVLVFAIAVLFAVAVIRAAAQSDPAHLEVAPVPDEAVQQ